MVKISANCLQFKGSNFMRQRLILSILSGKSICISEIRSKDVEPGLREYEVNLLRLVDKITNGTYLEVNETGTSFVFTPGSLIGDVLEHECCKLRGIGYYLEVIFAVAPFCKKPLNITLRGVTNNKVDTSVDAFKTAAVPVLQKFIVVDPGIEFKINKRGLEPEGGGEINFICPILKLKAIQWKDVGKIKKVRGTVFACRVSPSLATRFVEAAKGEMLNFLPNVFITTDHQKGPSAGKSSGFGGCLVAETTTGTVLCGERVSSGKGREVAEEVGREAAWYLLDEVSRGGVLHSDFQPLALVYMSLGQKDVSQILTGPLSPYTIEMLRHIRSFFNMMFKLDPYLEDCEESQERLRKGTNKVLITGVGIGYNRLA